MFRLQIPPPLHRKLKGFPGTLQQLHRLGIGQPLKAGIDNALQRGKGRFVVPLIEKGQVLGAVFQGVGKKGFEKILGQFRQPVQVAKSHFRLHHPELSQMAGSVGVFGPKGGAKGINIGQGQGKNFRFQLAADGQISGPAKEIGGRIHGSGPARRVIQVHSSNPEHRPGALGIAGRYHRRLDILKAPFLKEAVNGIGHSAADAGHSPESVGARAQMGNFPQKFQGMPFLLQGILLRVGRPQQLHLPGLDFILLPPPPGFHQFPHYADAATGVQGFHQGIVRRGLLHHDLQVFQGRAVADLDKGNGPGGAAGFDPALDQHFTAGGRPAQDVPDFAALH